MVSEVACPLPKNTASSVARRHRVRVLSACADGVKYIEAKIAAKGYEVRTFRTLTDLHASLDTDAYLIAVLDTAIEQALLFNAYEVLATHVPPIPVLFIVRADTSREQAMHGQILGKFDEIITVDDTFNATYLLQRLDALLARTYPEADLFLATTSALEGPRPTRQGKIITVFSPKGGAGKTTIATNLAIALTTAQQSVVLVDADLCFGTVSVLLGIDNSQASRACTIYDLADAVSTAGGINAKAPAFDVNSISPDLLEQTFYAHSSGLKVVLCPNRPDQAERIPGSVVERVVILCTAMFDYVIVDTPVSYGDTVLSLFDISNQILVILLPELSVLKNAAQFVSYAESFGWQDKLMFVLNRASSDRYSMISADDVRKVINAPVFPIASSGTAVTAMNKGRPLVTEFRNDKMARDIISLASLISARPQHGAKSNGKAGAGVRKWFRFGHNGGDK